MDNNKVLTQEEINDLLQVMVSSGADIEPFPVDKNNPGKLEVMHVGKKLKRKKLPIIVLYKEKN